MSTSRDFHVLTVAGVERLCDDAAAVTFDVPAALAELFAFRAGQALTLRREVDGVEERRTYSICAAPGRPPRIGVREIPRGVFSSWLVHQVQPGDRVEVQAPSGRFCPDPEVLDRPGRHLCIAAGSGITPVLSVAGAALRHPDSSVTLIYGNRSSGSVMFAEELGDLKNQHGPRLQVAHVLSREPRDAALFTGRLEPDRVRRILAALVPGPVGARFDHVWLCGPFAMVTGLRELLVGLGVPPERIHLELFHVDEPPPLLLREDPAAPGETTEVTVVLDGLSTTAAMPRDRPVLDAAQATRADLPYACKGGVCGTCRALVRDGTADMRRNYALEPAEVEAGFVLTCQSYPTGERLTVDFDA